MGPMCDAYRAQALRVSVLRAPAAWALVAMLSLGPVFIETSAVRGLLQPALAQPHLFPAPEQRVGLLACSANRCGWRAFKAPALNLSLN